MYSRYSNKMLDHSRFSCRQYPDIDPSIPINAALKYKMLKRKIIPPKIERKQFSYNADKM